MKKSKVTKLLNKFLKLGKENNIDMDKKSWEESFKNFLGQTTDQDKDLKVDSSEKYTTSEVPLTPENVKRNLVDKNIKINSDNLLIQKSDQTGKLAIDQSQKAHPCYKCGKILKTEQSWERHFEKCQNQQNYLQKVKKAKNVLNNKLFKSKRDKSKYHPSKEESYESKQCLKCGKLFTTAKSAENHYEKCKNQENYMCKTVSNNHQRLLKRKEKKKQTVLAAKGQLIL